jgi:hypothetical protein
VLLEYMVRVYSEYGSFPQICVSQLLLVQFMFIRHNQIAELGHSVYHTQIKVFAIRNVGFRAASDQTFLE